MPVTQTTKVVSQGMQDLMTVKLNADCTAYEANPVKWVGETSLTFSPTRQTTELASGNDPAYMVIEGYVTGDVELVLHDVALDKMSELFGVKYDATNGVVVGDNDDPVVFIGLSIDRLVKSADGATSRNKLILHKVKFNLPSIEMKTIETEDNAVANITLSGKAYPVFFTRADGSDGARTYTIVNSKTNSVKYLANRETIVYPTEIATPSL